MFRRAPRIVLLLAMLQILARVAASAPLSQHDDVGFDGATGTRVGKDELMSSQSSLRPFEIPMRSPVTRRSLSQRDINCRCGGNNGNDNGGCQANARCSDCAPTFILPRSNRDQRICIPCGVGYQGELSGQNINCNGGRQNCPHDSCGDSCALNYHVVSGACVACTNAQNEAGDNPSGGNTACDCPDDFRFDGGTNCVACPTNAIIARASATGVATTCSCPDDFRFDGTNCVACPTNAIIARASATGVATTCTLSCDANKRVVNNGCQDCPLGEFCGNASYQVPGAATSNCAATTCLVNQRVNNYACATCPAGTIAKQTGDPTNFVGGETFCLCARNYRINDNGTCEGCPQGSTNAPGDVTNDGPTYCTLGCGENHDVKENTCVACLDGKSSTIEITNYQVPGEDTSNCAPTRPNGNNDDDDDDDNTVSNGGGRQRPTGNEDDDDDNAVSNGGERQRPTGDDDDDDPSSTSRTSSDGDDGNDGGNSGVSPVPNAVDGGGSPGGTPSPRDEEDVQVVKPKTVKDSFAANTAISVCAVLFALMAIGAYVLHERRRAPLEKADSFEDELWQLKIRDMAKTWRLRGARRRFLDRYPQLLHDEGGSILD